MDQQELHERLTELEAEVTRLREVRLPRVDRSSKRRDRRLTTAYVLGVVGAVGLAGLGSASALDGSNTVFSDDIVDGTLTSLDVKNNAIITSDIKDDTIGSRDITDESITGADVTDGTIGSFDIANGTIGSWDVADGTIGGIDVIDGDITTTDISDGSITSVDVANGSIRGEDIDLFNDNQCSGETVLGTAIVNADAAVPSTYTTNWLGWQHSCSGQPVQVRREFTGSYFVKFSGPARLAVVTPGDPVEVAVKNVGPGEFRVQLWFWRSVSGGFYELSDTDFSILAY